MGGEDGTYFKASKKVYAMDNPLENSGTWRDTGKRFLNLVRIAAAR